MKCLEGGLLKPMLHSWPRVYNLIQLIANMGLKMAILDLVLPRTKILEN